LVCNLVCEAIGKTLGILDFEIASFGSRIFYLETNQGQGRLLVFMSIVSLVCRAPQFLSFLNHTFHDHHETFSDLLTVFLLFLQAFEPLVGGQHNFLSDEWSNGS